MEYEDWAVLILIGLLGGFIICMIAEIYLLFNRKKKSKKILFILYLIFGTAFALAFCYPFWYYLKIISIVSISVIIFYDIIILLLYLKKKS